MPVTERSWPLSCPRAGLIEKPEEKANLAAGLDILGSRSFREGSDGDGPPLPMLSDALCIRDVPSPNTDIARDSVLEQQLPRQTPTWNLAQAHISWEKRAGWGKG